VRAGEADELTGPRHDRAVLWDELIRMDPETLEVRSRTPAPLPGDLTGIAADANHVYLVGTALARVDTAGRIGPTIRVPNLATAALDANGLVGLTYPEPAFVRLSPSGEVIARIPLRDSSAQLVTNGRNAWFAGDGGAGPGIVHVSLPVQP
jgi:hypothetical protein